MINDLCHGYDVSSTLTSNFSVDFDFLSWRRSALEYGFRESSFPRSASRRLHGFLLWLSFPAPQPKGIEVKKGGEYHRQRSMPRKLCTWRDSRLFAINGFRSSSETSAVRESLALSRLYCFRWRGNSSNRGLKIYFLSEERKGLFWKSFIDRNLNSSIMIIQCVIIFN